MEEKFIFLIIGAVIGFIVSLLKDLIFNYLKDEKIKKDLALKRLEELFILINKYSDKSRMTMVHILSPKEAKLEFDETSSKISFLVRSSFTSLNDRNKSYLGATSKFVNYQIEVCSKTIEMQEEKYTPLQKEFEKEFGLYCTDIIEETKKYK